MSWNSLKRKLDKALPHEVVLEPFVFLDVQRFCANSIERVIDDGQFALLQSTADDIEVRFRLQIMATEPQRVDASWPVTWWDAVKLRFFPRWALRRWPAAMNRLHVERCGLYPEIPWTKSHGRRGKLTAIPFLSEYRGTYSENGGDDDD